MKKFNRAYTLILESIFKPASDEELAQRKIDAPKIIVQEWLEEFYKRKDIHKNEDGSYDVDEDVNLVDMMLEKFPLKFNKVSGSFYCYSNKLTSLEGAPTSVGGDFWCNVNNLTTLEGAPPSVGGNFLCNSNKLTSLEGAPTFVGGNFVCYKNKKKFTEEDVRAVSNVKGVIYV